MARQPRLSAEEIAARTPASRDRYTDFLRFASLAVVVLGHWLLAVVVVKDGRVETERLLTAVPATVWLTWIFQVMPIFFMVGGFANATSLARRPDAVNWIRARARRLMRPIVPLFIVWVALTALLAYGGLDASVVRKMSWAAVVPVWFLAAYLVIVALAPMTYRLHQRHGASALAAMCLLALGVDVVFRFTGLAPGIGYANYVLVWGAIHQVGYFWHDGRLPERLGPMLLMAAAGYAGLLMLTQFAGYPLSMVAGAEKPTNTTPPSIALLFLALGQLGLLLALRRPAQAWLGKPRPWANVVRGSAVMMSVFLWHMTALIIVAAALIATGMWPDLHPTQALWWLIRPIWLAVLAVVLAGLVLVVGRFERAGPAPHIGAGGVLAVTFGILATSASLGLLVHDGIYDASYPLGVPWAELILLAGGLWALGVVGPQTNPAPGQDDG
jgi:hypothetical protein